MAELSPTNFTVSLEAGSYDVYAVRLGAQSGWRVGHIVIGASETPAQRWIGDPHGDRLTRTWERGAFHINVGAHGDFADELLVAAATRQLVLRQSNAREFPLVVGDGDESLMLPDDVVREAMTRRYGPSGLSVAPSRAEWMSILNEMEICLSCTYSKTPGAPLLEGRCRSLAQVTVDGPAEPTPNFTLRSVEVDVNSDSAPIAGPTLALGPERVHLAQVGESLDSSSIERLYLCSDQVSANCSPLQTSTRLSRPGLYYVVRAASSVNAASPQALSLLRLAVIDPQNDWRPVGLASQHNSDALWARLPREFDRSITVRRRDDALRTELRTSPASSSVFRGHSTTSVRQMTLDVPTYPAARNEQSGEPSAPPSAALVQVLSDSATCPQQTARDLAATAALQAEQLSPERPLYLILSEYRGIGEPLRCLAFSKLRVSPQRSLLVGGRFRFGLVGDASLRTTFVLPDGFAAPVLAQSLAYIRACVFCAERWYIGGDLSIEGTIGAHFSRGGLGQFGFTSSLSLVFGYGSLPRLLSLGLALNIVAVSSQGHSPFALQLGINLSELTDLMRGR